jgi:hypothetical protein
VDLHAVPDIALHLPYQSAVPVMLMRNPAPYLDNERKLNLAALDKSSETGSTNPVWLHARKRVSNFLYLQSRRHGTVTGSGDSYSLSKILSRSARPGVYLPVPTDKKCLSDGLKACDFLRQSDGSHELIDYITDSWDQMGAHP